MSKHGGSPTSGIVSPAGLEQHDSLPSGIVVPEIVRTNVQAKERAKEFERRRIALAVLSTATFGVNDSVSGMVDLCLQVADDLLAKTGNHV